MTHIAEQIAEKRLCEEHGVSRQKNGVCPKCYYREWYAKNKDSVIARTEQWKRENRAKHLEGKNRWRARHGERVRQITRQRRVKLRGGEYRPYTEAEVYALHGDHCYLCGLPINPDARGAGLPTFDHVVPISRGGPDVLENVRPAHLGCNSRKQNKTLEELAA